MKRIQRIISGCLTVCMIFSMLPMQAFANEIEPAMETIATEVATKEAVEENAVPTETVTGQIAETAAPIVETVESQFSAAAMNVAATVSGTCGENLTWEFDSESETLTISGFGEMESFDGFLSETDNYSPWHDIGIKIKHIVIEEGVTTLGDYAMDNCSLLEDIYIPASITELNFTTQIPWSSKLNKFIVSENNAHYSSDEYGFLYSKDKKTLIGCPTAYSGAYRIADGTIEIGERAFDCCSYVSEVYLPNSIKRIGESAFEGCFSLREIILPEGLEEIGQEAFLGCEGLQEMVIPSTVSVIDFFVFVGCENLKSVKFVGNAPSTSDAAFYEFSTTAYYPSNNPTWTEEKRASFDGTIEWIPYDDMQDHVHSYEAAVTPPSCIEQGYTTYSCDCGHSYVSDYVDETGHVFGQWYEVKAPTAESEGIEQRDCANCDHSETNIIEKLATDDNTEAEISGTCGDNLTWTLDSDGVLIISGTGKMTNYFEVENVPWYSYRENIQTIVLETGVTSIGRSAFLCCSSLSSVTIPDSVTSIGYCAFFGCSSLCSVEIPDDVTVIGDSVFYGCSKLTSVTIPDSVTDIGGYAFKGCSSLSSMTIPDSVTYIYHGAFSGCSSLAGVMIPDSVTFIGFNAFSGCSSLASVAIPDSVTSIGPDAFSGCSSLASVTIPDSITSIGDGMFSGCSSLFSVTIPDSATSIGASAFNGCSSLNSIILSERVTFIDNYAFHGCDSLTDVYYSGTQASWEAIPMGTSNDCLTSAKIHYNSLGPDDGYSENGSVRYFHSWDEENQIACFDTDPEEDVFNKGCQVTEETDTSFLADVDSLVGTYVLVESKVRTDGMFLPDTLISIKPVETKVGIVTAIDDMNGTISIDGREYPQPDWLQDSIKTGRAVMYHLYDGTLVGEITQYTGLTEGIVTYWDSDSGNVTVNAVTYKLSDFIAEEVHELLGPSGDKLMRVHYLAYDNMIFDLAEDVDKSEEFVKSIYHADVLLSDFSDNLAFCLDYFNKYSPSRLLLETNNIEAANKVWSFVTVLLDTITDGNALSNYAFEQVDFYEALLLSALEVAAAPETSDVEGTAARPNIAAKTKELNKNTKTVLKLIKDGMAANDGFEKMQLSTMAPEDLSAVKTNLKNVLKQSTGRLYDTANFIDELISVSTTVKDLIDNTHIYAELWNYTDSMALVLKEMKANTPNDFNHLPMHQALDFCIEMICETSAEQFADGTFIHNTFNTGVQFGLDKGVKYLWKHMREKLIDKVPGVALLYAAIKSGRAFTDMALNLDDISEQTYKLIAINEYSRILETSIESLAVKYAQNKSEANASAVIDALSLRFGFFSVDCNTAVSYAKAVKDVHFVKAPDEAIYELNIYVPKIHDYAKQVWLNADTNWVFELKEDYPDLYPEFSYLVSEEYSKWALGLTFSSSYVIECPVDVAVYDRDGKLVASLTENGAYCIGEVYALQISDRKFVDIYNGNEYRIECIGYDSGTMDICITEKQNLQEIRKSVFDNLDVSDKIEYGMYNKIDPTDSEIHSIVCNDDTIEADFDSNIHSMEDHDHLGGIASCSAVAKCVICGTSYGDKDSTNHTGETEIRNAKDSQEFEDGYTGDTHCVGCGELLEKGKVIPATHKHSYKDTVTEPTCTEPGSTVHTCSCGDILTETLLPIGHNYDEGMVTTDPGCETEGVKTFTCQNDKSHTYTEPVPATGHSYDDNVDGTCNGCGVNRETVEIRQVTHMFRMYNPNTGEHFYTGSEEEKSNLVAVGWQYEGVGFTFPANTGAPVHRLFQPSTGEHLYTMNEAEKASLMANGWNYEGIAFNSAYDTEAVQHRLHNPNATVGAYHFTFSLEEKQNLINAGWEYQGIGWYSCWK